MSQAPDTPQETAPEHCPTCGCRVRVVSGDEGTSYFRPVLTESEINEALEDPVIAARLARVEERVEERFGKLNSTLEERDRRAREAFGLATRASEGESK